MFRSCSCRGGAGPCQGPASVDVCSLLKIHDAAYKKRNVNMQGVAVRRFEDRPRPRQVATLKRRKLRLA
jgi:hypothetical protein